MKKIKFYDSICFRGELEILIFRLTELDPYVDGFIIADLNQSDTNWDLLKKWESKIHIISVTEENCFESIKNQFIKLNPMFEDVLMISNTNEVPNLKDKDPFFEKLRFEYFIIEHSNFIWNYDYVNVEPSRGTLVTNLSLIVQTKNVVDKLIKMKTTLNLARGKVLNNGWKFSNFKYDSNYDFYIKEKLFPTKINPVTTYQLIKHNNQIELPTNVDLLPYVKIGRDEVRKHLFLVESDIEYMDGYDTITIIKFSSNLQETLCEKVSDITTKSVLYLPNVVLYGDSDLETFQDEYMLNETKRMFSAVFPQEQDIIDVIFKNKKPLGLGGGSY
jgi:hypothetical protein